MWTLLSEASHGFCTSYWHTDLNSVANIFHLWLTMLQRKTKERKAEKRTFSVQFIFEILCKRICLLNESHLVKKYSFNDFNALMFLGMLYYNICYTLTWFIAHDVMLTFLTSLLDSERVILLFSIFCKIIVLYSDWQIWHCVAN